MDIIIKSFNRPFYLDRCIASIYLNVKGSFRITVLDDGTPEKYISELQKKYPEVHYLFSKQASEKRRAIKENLENGTPINGFKIPTDLWKNAVAKASEYVLVTEDDVWFTSEINMDEIITEMKSINSPLVKLGWLGRENEKNYCSTESLTKNLENSTPKKLFTANKVIMDWFMYNKYKFYTLLYKLGKVDNTTRDNYWSINSILMGLFRKEYWLAIWEDAAGQVDEKQQLRNAAAWFHKNPKALFVKTKNEVLKTTFKSSATGSYHAYGNHFDVNRFNHIMNEAWLNGDFDCMENYPKDFSDSYFIHFLEKIRHEKAKPEEWLQWSANFKQQYANIGAEVN